MSYLVRKISSSWYTEEPENLNEAVEDPVSKNEADVAIKTTPTSSPNKDGSVPLAIPVKASLLALSDINLTPEAFSSMSTSDEIASSMGNMNHLEENLPTFSLAEVREHSDPSDAWIVLYDRVYDVTTFLHEVCVKIIF